MAHDLTSRRDFLKSASVGALLVAFSVPVARSHATGSALIDGGGPNPLNAYVRVSADGTVTIVLPKSEIGQGAFTGCAQLLGEELEVDWRSVRVETAPVDPIYNSVDIPFQNTGGSESISANFGRFREAGATARCMLVTAASQELGVPEVELVAANGAVLHRASGRSVGYGALAARAATLPVPKSVTLKPPGEWRLIGKSLPRLDSREKSDGSALFGCDVRLPGMHYAVVARPPTFGGTVAAVDDAACKKIPGVVAVFRISTGVAVVARNTWSALKGRSALDIHWDGGLGAGFSTTELAKRYADIAQTPGIVAYKAEAPGVAHPESSPPLVADYVVPYLAHAPMEPLNCAVALTPNSCDVYVGTQSPTVDRDGAAEVAGLPPEKVRIHTPFVGGGFGRRSPPNAHIVREAVEVAKAFGRAPVMTVWSREDDMCGGYYRPQAHQRLVATFGTDGLPATWHHTIVAQSIAKGNLAEPYFVDKDTGLDYLAHQGASDIPYAIPDVLVDVHQPVAPVPVLWMRSVAHSYTAFAVESFIDECAHRAGRNPLDYRLALLHRQPKYVATLNLLAEKSGWGQKPPRGRARGLAIHKIYDTIVAQVAEVSVRNGKPYVHRIVMAVSCGTVVNPRLVAQQLEGAVPFAMSSAMHGEITIANGRVQQGNFDRYEVTRMVNSPVVEVHVVPSTDPPSGIGELGVPAVAPAVANALFALTGVRARRLPLKHTIFPS